MFVKWLWGTSPVLNALAGEVCWDQEQQQLSIVRNIDGLHTSFYALLPDGVLCASEPATLLAHPGVSATWDDTWIAYWLGQGIDHWRHTPWQAIHPIPPGHRLVVKDRQARLESCWFPPARLSPRQMSFEDAARQLRDTLCSVVLSYVPAEGIITTDCSGGMDSSTLTVLLAQLGQQGHLSQEAIPLLHVYSERYPEEDARPFVQALCTRYPALQPNWIALDSLLDLPYARPKQALYPSTHSVLFPALSQMTEQVLQAKGSQAHLMGSFSDFYWGQHSGYLIDVWQEGRLDLLRELTQWLPTMPWSTLRRASRASRWAQRPRPVCPWLAPNLLEHIAEQEEEDARWCRRWLSDPFQRVLVAGLHRDQQTLKLTETLAERGITPCLPFLSQPIIEFFCQCPAPFLVSGQPTKALLRTAMQDLLPQMVLQRQDKGNATRPISAWGRFQATQLLTHYAAVPASLHPFIQEEALISAFARFSAGAHRDQRLIYPMLALIAHTTFVREKKATTGLQGKEHEHAKDDTTP